MSADELVIPAPSDYHVHFRNGAVTRTVAPAHAWAGRVLVMPNTEPPVLTGRDALEYEMLCGTALPRTEILTTIKLTPDTTPETIRAARKCGVVAAKLYPDGMTTNSHGGIPGDWLRNPVPAAFGDVMSEMADVGMVLCCHGEMPGYPTFAGPVRISRSDAFASWVREVLFGFPRLRVVLEHVSTRYEAACVEEWQMREPGRLAATVTPHHLVRTIDDVVGDKLAPHEFCKPVPKTEYDRYALELIVTRGNPAFFLGTDSAPHHTGAKECAAGCAGVFNAHAALSVVADVFDRAGALDKLAAFTSGNGDTFYGRETTRRRTRLTRKPYRVPHDVDGGALSAFFRPWRASELLPWSWGEVT